ncbi:MAG: ATP-binding cassette domain-containing protein [Luteimonas sp.]|nr:ATP-binding cassette domain-containing protein [Luteimonas sp.]
MTAFLRARDLSLDVPAFFQSERSDGGWNKLFLGAAFDPPKRRVVRLLDKLSFDVREGDRLAILGRNGAGKSTLLRVMNRVYQPTSGSLEIGGSCQALLNMSLGFNGYATVRENIVLRGVAMGLPSVFLRGHADEILAFAGLREKSSHLLRTLSSGQKLRLGFAISTVAQHDIILMDEWVGTGDSDFMAKAKDRMRDRVGGSKIVVLASHSTGLLRDICNKGVVLEAGKLVFHGDVSDALKFYHDLMARVQAGEVPNLESADAPGGAQVFGAIEGISMTEVPGRLLVSGWMVDTHGRTPSGLVLEWNGLRFPHRKMKRVKRPDVMRHFGLNGDECGFLARIDMPGISALSDLGQGEVRFFGGHTTEEADAPLRLAASVMALMAPAPMADGSREEPTTHDRA